MTTQWQVAPPKTDNNDKNSVFAIENYPAQFSKSALSALSSFLCPCMGIIERLVLYLLSFASSVLYDDDQQNIVSYNSIGH